LVFRLRAADADAIDRRVAQRLARLHVRAHPSGARHRPVRSDLLGLGHRRPRRRRDPIEQLVTCNLVGTHAREVRLRGALAALTDLLRLPARGGASRRGLLGASDLSAQVGHAPR